jgi:hypothetical protein
MKNEDKSTTADSPRRLTWKKKDKLKAIFFFFSDAETNSTD